MENKELELELELELGRLWLARHYMVYFIAI